MQEFRLDQSNLLAYTQLLMGTRKRSVLISCPFLGCLLAVKLILAFYYFCKRPLISEYHNLFQNFSVSIKNVELLDHCKSYYWMFFGLDCTVRKIVLQNSGITSHFC